MHKRLRKFNILWVLSTLLIFISPHSSLGYDTYNDATAGLPGEYFTNFGTSARAFGMGKAYTALANDASGPYWNPSGLVGIKANEFSFMSTKLYIGTDYNFAGFAMSVSSKTFYGVSWAGIAIQGIREIDDSGEFKGVFSDSHNIYYITYARKLSPLLSMGWNLKTLYHSMKDAYSTAFGLDFGLMFHPGEVFSVGINLQNIPPVQPSLKLGSQHDDPEDIFPINLKTGMALKLFKESFIIAGDIDWLNLFPDKDSYAGGNTEGAAMLIKWHAGIEITIARFLAFRAGVDNKDLSVGFGLVTRKMGIDYAAIFHFLGLTHRFGVTLKFGVAPSEEERFFAEKVKKIDKMKEDLEKEKEELNAFRDELAKREKIVDEIMMSTKKVEEGRYRAFTLQKIYDKALEWFDEDSYDQAEVKAKEVLELDKDDEGAMALIRLVQAQKYLGMGKYNKALKQILEALELDPDNERAKEMLKKMKDILLLIE